jgi:hypothetical protein
LGKILPEACESVEIFSQNPEGLTFTAQSVGLCWPPYLCWIFYFFVGKYYTQKVLVVFVFLNPFGKRNQSKKTKGFFFIGAYSLQKMKTYRWKCVGKWLG